MKADIDRTVEVILERMHKPISHIEVYFKLGFPTTAL